MATPCPHLSCTDHILFMLILAWLKCGPGSRGDTSSEAGGSLLSISGLFHADKLKDVLKGCHIPWPHWLEGVHSISDWLHHQVHRWCDFKTITTCSAQNLWRTADLCSILRKTRDIVFRSVDKEVLCIAINLSRVSEKWHITMQKESNITYWTVMTQGTCRHSTHYHLSVIEMSYSQTHLAILQNTEPHVRSEDDPNFHWPDTLSVFSKWHKVQPALTFFSNLCYNSFSVGANHIAAFQKCVNTRYNFNQTWKESLIESI